ncbi:60S acidic ribosomal protein P2 [Aspergillus foveolatus]|uniref:60S acidic ribosomal protein P2 n=1 Tax=Aspergillus foveolatus TaxID=210207 RepID=UPI003CCD5829
MKHLAAYLLLTLGGISEPGADDIREVLASVGIEADEVRLAQLLNELRGKDIHELIAEGESKLATLGTIEGGGKPGPGTPMIEGGKRDKELVDSDVDGDEGEDEDEDEDFGLGLFN